MARLWLPLTVFAALTSLVSADVEFTSPKAGATLTAGSTITVEWKESGDAPKIADLTTYQLFLCAGGNEAASILQLIELTAIGGSTFEVTGNKAQGTVGIGIGASTPKNSYFLKMISTAQAGGTITNFSPRFSYSGMTGVFPDSVIQGMKTVKGTDGPDRIDATAENNPNAAVPVNGDVYNVEYNMQTGPTRYAPMQPVPPTKISKKDTKPLHSTSSVKIATTALPIPAVQMTTFTQSQTYSVSSMENTVAAAPMPSDDMAKFLNRWKD
ncbi:hypothetical protein P154DRAFT_521089 [Amniculicola lignicola CBS 123094]|uniref:Uncharacterized protein n=1 Tax=Amniculicola lignicola CBS 123094 TaxID=1392246 RepID=A0A6A5WMZ9_9PLEO|nr:hypothetical protein P154DRAFT_521089 [Amniculicola lignicola CBS 123094]